MDIGVWMSPGVLAHKLEARAERNTLANWNTKSVPSGLGQSCEGDRLFVATRGAWRGYFVLSKEALYTPQDAAARELREETGIVARSWDFLGQTHLSNSITDEVGYLYVARDLVLGGASAPEGTEELRVRRVPFAEDPDNRF